MRRERLIMGILKPVLILAILSSVFLCSNAWAAGEAPPRVGAVRDEAGPARDAPKKKPPKRRAVRQIIDGMPVPAAPPPAYAPQLNPPPAGTRPMPSPIAPAPVILNSCNGGACTDAGGARYNGGVGSSLLSPEGRLCNHHGVTIQCF